MRPPEVGTPGQDGRSRTYSARPAGRGRNRRGGIVFISILLSIFSLYLVYAVFGLQVTDHAEYLEKAAELHLQTVTDYPERGSLFDRNGTLLARTTYVSTVGVTPRDVRPWDEVGAATADETAAYAAGIAAALNMDPAEVLAVLEKKTDEGGKDIEYAVLKKDASKAESDALAKYKKDNSLGGIRIDIETRRYYPLGDLAPQVIGFTSQGENTLVGVAGVEAYYNEQLSGQPGYQYSEREEVFGGELPFSVSTSLQAKDGYSLQLTLDAEIQRITQEAIQRSTEASQLPEGAVGIVMDPYTGEILAMAQYPSFDLNNPTACPPGFDAASWNPEDEASMAYVQSSLWRNRSISDSFEAGSTFKSLTTTMAFDEGLAYEQELFSDQEILVGGWSLHCWSHPSNHGIETLEKAVWNSCNPVFVQLSQRIGLLKFYQYIHAFGFGTNTRVDLPAEALGLLHDNPTEIDMYTMSYGTSATVTPIQLCNAYCALANGGRLMRPTVVKALLDNEGHTVQTIQPQTIRQVISEKSAARVVKLLEGVVTHGTGSTGYVEGYTIAAKTGTTTRKTDDRNVASYVAVAPAENPEICVAVVMYGFDQNQWTFDCGRAAGSIISQTLEYRGIAREYTADDIYLLKQTIEIPDLTGKTFDEARQVLGALQVTGTAGRSDLADTDVIRSQVPAPGSKLRKNASVALYKEEQAPDNPVPIPDFTGLTVSEAARYASQCGLNILIQGDCLGVVKSQDPISPAAVPPPPDGSRFIQKGSQVSLVFEAPSEVATLSGQPQGGG